MDASGHDECSQCHKYSRTGAIIDCTELFCKRPSSIPIQSSLFSHYKLHVACKGLVSIDPSGEITLFIKLHDGAISNVRILQWCGILKKDLWNESDSLMVDRGSTVEKLLKPWNIPAFLHEKEQLANQEVSDFQTIAPVRQAECTVQKTKNFRRVCNESSHLIHCLLIKYRLLNVNFAILCYSDQTVMHNNKKLYNTMTCNGTDLHPTPSTLQKILNVETKIRKMGITFLKLLIQHNYTQVKKRI